MEAQVLWCRTCQSGPGGLNVDGKMKSGDICPMCVRKGRQGTEIDTLVTAEEEIKRIEEIAAFKKKQKEENAIKGQKGVDEAVKEAEDRMRGEVEQLRQQIQTLTKVKTIQSVKEENVNQDLTDKPKAKPGDNVKAEFAAKKKEVWVPANPEVKK